MENKNKQILNPVGLFLLLTFSLSAIFYFLIIYSGMLGGGKGMYVTGLMWSPGIAGLITMKILKRDVVELGWKWGKTKYQLWSYLIPILYAFITYVIIWSAGWGGFYDTELVNNLSKSFGLGPLSNEFIIILYVVLFAIFGTIKGAANALGEEIGWRGFLVPELYKTQGFTKTALITGFIWAIWHFPILLFADYNSGTPSWYAMSCFTVMVVSISFIFTWMRIKSNNFWTAVVLHATHNLFIQAIFTPLTFDTGNTAYYIDEFGIVLPIVTFCFAIYFWKRRDEL